MMKNDVSDFVRDLDDLIPAADKTEIFGQISQKLADKNEQAKRCRARIEQYEQSLATARDELRHIEEDEMPALLDELGVSSVTLKSGAMIVCDTSLHASIPASSRPDAYAWLRSNGNEGIIKNEFTIRFNKGEDNLVGHVKAVVEDLGLAYDQKESVHASTLKSFVKEQMKIGVTFPPSFEIYVRRFVDTK